MLDHTGTMTVDQLKKIRQMVLEGVSVLGEPPTATPGLTNYKAADAELKQLVKEIWGEIYPVQERKYGNGVVYRGITPEEAMARMNVKKDFTSDKPLKYIHRSIGDTDIYFVANGTERSFTAYCNFRVTSKAAGLWDAESGKIYPINAVASGASGLTTYAIPFEKYKSYFVVFTSVKTVPAAILTMLYNNKPMPKDILDNTLGIDMVKREISKNGTYTIHYDDGKSKCIIVASLPKPFSIAGEWAVKFPVGKGAPAVIKMDSLVSWSNYPDSGVQHFSGTATYSKNIEIDAGMLKKGQRIYLDLGTVEVMAKVKLNGTDIGIVWHSPYRLDITAASKAGNNNLEIELVNLWPNRLIGDESLPEDSKYLKNGVVKEWPDWLLKGKDSPTGRIAFSSRKLWNKGDMLQSSGLLGPVTLTCVSIY